MELTGVGLDVISVESYLHGQAKIRLEFRSNNQTVTTLSFATNSSFIFFVWALYSLWLFAVQ